MNTDSKRKYTNKKEKGNGKRGNAKRLEAVGKDSYWHFTEAATAVPGTVTVRATF